MFHHRIEPAPPPAVAPRPPMLLRLWRRWREARRRRTTLARLAALDDRLLRDIGLGRDDLLDPDFDPVRRLGHAGAERPVRVAAEDRRRDHDPAAAASGRRRPDAPPAAPAPASGDRR